MKVAVAERRFRDDLYHRLKEYTLAIPPLRECRDDILPLADFFRDHANREFDRHTTGFDESAKKALLSCPWKGNVRELKLTVRRAVLFTEGGTVTAEALETEDGEGRKPPSMKDLEKAHIIHTLEEADGNRKLAAEMLGIGRTTLYEKIKAYGIGQKKDET